MNRNADEVSIEEIHKEIDLIQSCITRMAQNSFMIKGWFVSIYAVILALLPEKVNLFLLCVVLTAINLSFWYLDGFFLRTEKLYRKMYQLNPHEFEGRIEEVESIWKIMWSKTLKWFYLIPLVIVIIVFIVNYGAILWKAI